MLDEAFSQNNKIVLLLIYKDILYNEVDPNFLKINLIYVGFAMNSFSTNIIIVPTGLEIECF